MKKLLPFLLLLTACHTTPQQSDEIRYKVYYAATFRNYEEIAKIYEDEKVLEIGTNCSRFYAVQQDRRQALQDSVIAAGGDFYDVLDAVADFPIPRQSYTIYKNHPQMGRLTYHDRSPIKIIYNEALELPTWEKLKGDTIIMDLKCKKAVTQYRGREWTAWYAPAIKESEGPWKLVGLPGLILYAADSKGDFTFACTDIKEVTGEKIKQPDVKQYKTGTRREYNELRRRHAENPEQFSKEQGMIVGPGFGPDGKRLIYEPRKPVLLDY